MGKTKITITGVPEKEPKINENKTVDLLFKNAMSEGVPKGLKSLGESIYLVHVAPKTWKKIAANVTKDSFYIIQGEPKATLNKKGIPFISVVCFDISLKENLKEPVTNIKIIEPTEVLATDNKIITPGIETLKDSKINNENVIMDQEALIDNTYTKKKKAIPKAWYDELTDNLVEIDLDDVSLTEKAHLSAYTVSVTGLSKVKEQGYVKAPIAVRQLEDGKYALVAGYKPYIQSKLLNFKTIKAYITDLNHHDFVFQFNLDESKK